MLKRQGDLLFKKAELPKNVVKKLNKTVAKGEHTNHSHRFSENSSVALYESSDQLFIQVDQEADLVHEEHGKIKFEPGVYTVVNEREFDYFLNEVRRVQD